MEKEYPWLVEEKKAIKEFVINLKKPYLGFCLGCQLLGEVVGGKVVKSSTPEIGIMDINFNKEKDKDNFFSKFPEQIKSLQWHSYEVVDSMVEFGGSLDDDEAKAKEKELAKAKGAAAAAAA